MSVKLLTEHHYEFLSLNGGCTDLSQSTLVKMSNCWKSHALANIQLYCMILIGIGRVQKIKSHRFSLKLYFNCCAYMLYNQVLFLLRSATKYSKKVNSTINVLQ